MQFQSVKATRAIRLHEWDWMPHNPSMTLAHNEPDPADRQLVENVTTMLFRCGERQQDAAHQVGMTPATFSRRMSGQQPWLLREVRALSAHFGVTLSELTTGLPSYDEWQARDLRACRDSNPKPSDLYLMGAPRRLCSRCKASKVYKDGLCYSCLIRPSARVMAPFVLGRCPSCGAWTYDGVCTTPHSRSCHSGLDAVWVLAA